MFDVLLLLPLLLASASARAAVRYVDVNSTNATPPFLDWSTAATNIQDAVDVAVAGDEIMVTNGIYATGGRAVYGSMTNRVAVDKPLTVRSVNGPQFTVIQGSQVPGTTTGEGAIRCVYLASGAVLSGFTLTNGATRNSSDEESGGGVWCESINAVATNCTLTGNSASSQGGGAAYGTLMNCTLTGNSADLGGGAYSSTLNNCTLTANSASAGGGAYEGSLINCTLTANSAYYNGGGAYKSTLINCTLTGNSADIGGGASGGWLYNCTLTGNSAARSGGGADWSTTLNNCIVCFNTAANNANYDPQNSTLNYCCTTPMPTNGVGNITTEPQLASVSHLSASSPCRGAGSAAYAAGTDIDGEAWASPPSIGCDEYRAGAVTGAVEVAIGVSWTNVSVGFALDLTAWISGRVSASVWDFGDGTVLSNRPYASHAWGELRDYTVVLRAYNESHPEGVSATVTVRVVPPLRYVAAANSNPVPPYTSWESAAQTIQEAVDSAQAGDTAWVTNGVYATGGRAVDGTMTNRVAVSRAVTVRSVNGPEVTVIQGYQVPGTINGDGAIRCVYLTNGAVLSGFTLTNGATRPYSIHDYYPNYRESAGGGVWCESTNALVTNCTITGNSASLFGGGGAVGGTLNNCSLTGNTAGINGGGASDGTLNNCIVYFNRAPNGANYWESAFTYSCTTPLPPGVGNIDADPQLASITHLSPTSPCIGAGSPAYATGVDIDGEPWASPPAMGADQPGPVTGPLSLSIDAGFTNVVPGYRVSFMALNAGAVLKTVWDFGDGTVLTNQPFATHAWSVPGIYTVRLTGYNDSYPGGVTTTVVVTVSEAVSYVNLASANPVSPYGSWETAARTIQDAIGAGPVGRLVLVTNGVYRVGTVENNGLNRVLLTNGVAVRSVNGPEVTVIEGAASGVRCAYVGDGAVLSGFSLAKGKADYGGGVFCESFGVVTNCVLTGNSADTGGGASGGTLDNCVLTGNSAGLL